MTLTGAGGVGKTRLGLAGRRPRCSRFPEGAWLVELARSATRRVAEALAAVFGVSARGGIRRSTESLVEFLRPKQLLLVLDNCEHLLEPVAELVDVLERSVPAFGAGHQPRGPGLEGERVLPVPSLPAPAATPDPSAVAGNPAVQALRRTSPRRRPGLRADRRERGRRGQICRRLDGVPLAIELAAARVAP